MKRYTLGIILCGLSACLHLNGCSGRLFESLENIHAPERECRELLRCFSEKDNEGLKNMFCPISVSENNLEEQIQNASAFFDGTITAYDDIIQINDAWSIREGKTSILATAPRITGIQTDAGKTYEINFSSYLINSEQKDKVGISEIIIDDENGAQCKIGKYIE